ncbi:integrase arm-type DNA-binding domain-containing protein [Litorivicinus sp.]|nr:integrase arm-type DNA-binding domain-containing protein [Litorivicinus sp.]
MAISSKLTQKQITQTKGPSILNDGNGLYLRIRSSGTLSWFCRIRHPKTRKLVDKVFGRYPSTSLHDARNQLEEVKRSILSNCLITLNTNNSISFREYASQFIRRKAPEWRNQKHIQQWRNTLRDYAHPIIGDLNPSEITTTHIVQILEPIWTHKTETATRVRQRLEAILDSATVEDLFFGANPARWKGHLRYLLPDPSKIRKVRHQPAMPYSEVPEFACKLRTRDALSARLLEFVILTASRQSEARLATHNEIDRKHRIWTIPASRMKANKEHRVPLTDRMLEIIQACRTESDYLFADDLGGTLSINALRMLMKRMGFGLYVPHGFRSSFREWCAEQSTIGTFEVWECALGHNVGNATTRAYLRSDYLEDRRKLMALWCAFIETMRH